MTYIYENISIIESANNPYFKKELQNNLKKKSISNVTYKVYGGSFYVLNLSKIVCRSILEKENRIIYHKRLSDGKFSENCKKKNQK